MGWKSIPLFNRIKGIKWDYKGIKSKNFILLGQILLKSCKSIDIGLLSLVAISF